MRISKKVTARLSNDAEEKCEDMADVCELAHKRTVRDCRRLGITVDASDGSGGTKYRVRAQRIFDRHYDAICERTGI